MKIVFCEDPLRPKKVDEAYQAEESAAISWGLNYVTINFEALTYAHDSAQAVKHVPREEQPITGIYRGWMIRPKQYEALYNTLNYQGIKLINTPEAYQHCHYFPESYPIIAPYTPQSVWFPVSGKVNFDWLMELLAPFGSHPIVVKDFVKSQKHYWHEACFIASATDRDTVERVVRRFLELQGDDLNEGLVFREYVEFERLADHSKSGMPLSKEYRVFVLDGEPIHVVEYWEEGVYEQQPPPIEVFRETMKRVNSRFYTMDIARRQDGEWLIVELGDAQVSGLPETTDVSEFYERLAVVGL